MEHFFYVLRCKGGKTPTQFGPLHRPVLNHWVRSLRTVRSNGPNCVSSQFSEMDLLLNF